MGVANASVTGMLKRLSSSQPKLVNYERYGGATLTPEGRQAALEIIRHHRLIESYLSQKLGYSWDEVHAEAERLEHFISEEMEDRMAAALGNPTIDPHGDPIPDRNGRIRPSDLVPLTDFPEGKPAAIGRITRQDPELLRYLSEHGLRLSARILVRSKAPFKGPVSIQVRDAGGAVLPLSWEVAERIWVKPESSSLTEIVHE
jgi:DtxR family Mn-dependent transcriptional regulator